MWISFKNIGVIKEAKIELNGITVIAGENGTGKSTAGKALYAVFHGLHRYNEKINNDIIRNVEYALDYLYQDSPEYETPDTNKMAVELVNQYRTGSSVRFENPEEIIMEIDPNYKKRVRQARSITNDILERIQKILSISEEEAVSRVVSNQINAEFSGQCRTLQAKENGEINIGIQDKTINILIDENQNASVQNPILIQKNAVYIDDPFVIDTNYRVGRSSPYGLAGYANMDHRIHLLSRLIYRPEPDIINEIVTEDGFQNVFQQIETVCAGRIVRKEKGTWGYTTGKSEQVLDIHNLSTGMKTFTIIKMLLMNGTLEYNGTIILDEPEIHLHPEWQLTFAELIVCLQKEFHMNILLNTHSPYFMRAIEVYAAKYQIADVCRYYKAEKEGDFARMEDVSNNTEMIYAKLAAPFQKLENEGWVNG